MTIFLYQQHISLACFNPKYQVKDNSENTSCFLSQTDPDVTPTLSILLRYDRQRLVLVINCFYCGCKE